jgi:hypothetical protein
LDFLNHVNPNDYTGYSTVKDPLNGDDSTLNQAYLQLELDISNGADKQPIKADAQQVEQLAGSDHPGLAAAAHNISASIDDGSYDQTGSLNALMNNPSNAAALPPSSSPPPKTPNPTPPFPQIPQPQSVADETADYQKLLADIQSGADPGTLLNDAVALARAAIRDGDLGLAQAALNVGEALKAGSYDRGTAMQALTGAAPGTPGAQMPPVTGWTTPPIGAAT